MLRSHPRCSTTPLEISSNLRQLQESHDPLIITFHERSQRFQSYLVDLDRDSNMIALDEMIPRDGERLPAGGRTVQGRRLPRRRTHCLGKQRPS